MKVSVLVVAVFALGGCATETLQWVFSGAPPAEFVGPDGQKGYVLTCRSSMATCYNDARSACQGDYEVLNQNERTTYTPADRYTDASTSVARTLTIACAT